jgi:hypothetical protein
MKRNYLFLFAFLIPFFSFAQTLEFLDQSTSDNVFTSHQFNVSVYHDGHFYIAGSYWQDISFGSFSLSLPNSDTRHSFILKVSETGEVEDVWEFSSQEFARINQMVVNPLDKTLTIIGGFWKNIIYDNVELSTSFFGDGYVMNLNLDGSLNWVKQLASQNVNSFSFGEAVTVDKVGNLYVGFEMFGTLNFGGVEYETSSESVSALIVKLDSDGNVLNAQPWLGSFFENLLDIVDLGVDEDNNLIIAGGLSGTADIDGQVINSSSFAAQSFVIKESSELEVSWVKQYVGSNSLVNDIDIVDNKIIVSLQYRDYCQIDDLNIYGSGSWGDLALLSVAPNGDTEVLQNLTLTQNGGTAGVYGIDMTSYQGKIYVGGFYQGNVENEEGVILENIAGSDFQFPFLLSMNEAGEIQDVYDFDGSSGPCRLQTITSSDQRLLFSGEFSSQIALEDTTLQTVNSTLFYGSLLENVINNTIDVEQQHCVEKISPTIVNNSLTILSENALKSIQIMDVSGKVIKTIATNHQINPEIVVNDLSPGTYFLNASCETGMKAFKFIKQ